MKLIVYIKSGSKKIKVVRHAENLFVHLTARAQENKANLQLIEVLAEYFQIPKNRVIITSGLTTKIKRVLILNK
jgi:hypothetical protein